MIGNLTAHTGVPRRNPFQNRTIGRRRRTFSFNVDKQLLSGIAKVASLSVLFLVVFSIWLGASVEQVTTEIQKEKNINNKLADVNILLRAQKAQLFSPEAVDALARNKLAIHLPDPGQYHKL